MQVTTNERSIKLKAHFNKSNHLPLDNEYGGTLNESVSDDRSTKKHHVIPKQQIQPTALSVTSSLCIPANQTRTGTILSISSCYEMSDMIE